MTYHTYKQFMVAKLWEDFWTCSNSHWSSNHCYHFLSLFLSFSHPWMYCCPYWYSPPIHQLPKVTCKYWWIGEGCTTTGPSICEAYAKFYNHYWNNMLSLIRFCGDMKRYKFIQTTKIWNIDELVFLISNILLSLSLLKWEMFAPTCTCLGVQ